MGVDAKSPGFGLSAQSAPGDELAPQHLSAPSRWKLDSVVAELRMSREVTHNIRPKGRFRRPPAREAIAAIVEGLAASLFPAHYGGPELAIESLDYFVGATLNQALARLVEQVRLSLSFASESEPSEADLTARAQAITREFASRLPAIRGLLVNDLRAAFAGDPAAAGFPEILLGYPGMTAILHYRLAHALHELGAPLLARLVSEIAHSKTGIDIHPGAEIGASFFIDHGTGVVIGATAVIGERVRLYQAVTLGARHFPADENGALVKGAARHPIIEDDVVIYAGATILGRITIGRGSTIGGNVWLTHGVAPGSHVSQAQARNNGKTE
ncbi:serine O-acetyltransferase EpsC [Methylocapsa sp. S129]|uniref:serine O-acetyltransferase EpsC n=1 Tax=Methylocapsa sp. S129 TaxID=1641869 RepID=UPI00131C6810